MENNMNLTNKQKALAIYKWTLRKYLPMSIAYWILMFITFPMVEIFAMIVCISESGFETYVSDMKDVAAESIPGTFFAAIVILFSLILTIVVFSYMHNKRCVDLFGSFPISRRTLFFSRYFAALTACIVPLIIFGITGALLTFSDDGMIQVLKITAYLILGVISNVSFIAFISLCCGTVADVLISYLIINVIYPICVAICFYFPVSVIPGLEFGYLDDSIFTLFSPAAAPFVGIFGSSKTLHIVWWIGFTIILVAGCYVLCKKRKAETAQNAFAFSAVEIVIKFVTCFAAGFGVGWIFAFIGESSGGTVKAQYVWFFIGMFIGIMVVNFLLHLIFHRGLSKFKDSLFECGVVAVVATTFLFVITTGAFGYDERIPSTDNIEAVSLILDDKEFEVDGKNYLEIYKDDQETIEDFKVLHNNIISEYKKNKKGLYPIVKTYSDVTYVYEGDYEEAESQYYSVEMKYKLKNGAVMSRGYSTSGIKFEIPNKIDEKFAVSDEFVLNNLPEKYVMQAEVYKDGINYNLYNGYDYSKKEKAKELKKVSELTKALKKDVKENGISEKSGSESFSVHLIYETDDYRNVEYCDLEIPDTYVNTLKLIKENEWYYSEYEWLQANGGTVLSVNDAKKEQAGSEVVKTIYFKMPETWDKDTEVKCMLYSDDWCDFYTDLNSSLADCEKVSDDVWKYEIFDISDTEAETDKFNEVMFYQPSKTNFKCSGSIRLNKKNNMLVLGEKKKYLDISEYYDPLYKYEWTKYSE